MANYFPGLKSYDYSFVNEEVKARHAFLTNSKRQAMVLHELRDILSEFYDVSQLELIPRSKYAPDMLIEPCRKFGEGGKMPNVHWDALRTAVSRVKKKIRRVRGIKPIPLESVPFDGSTNSGLPYLAKKAEVADESLRRAKDCVEGACPPPMTMFSRGKNLDVARPVLCGPAEWQLVEGMFFYPLQDAIMTKNTPYVAGVPACSLGAKLNELTYYPYVLAMDYSGYDGSLSGLLINSAFGILRKCLDLDESEQRLWERIVSYFITAPILCPDQKVYYGRDHGVPSGSMFTQMIDSLCNMIIIEYVAIRTNLDLGKYYVLGDDSVVGCGSAPSVTNIAEAAQEIGITVSEKKTHVTDTSCDLAIHFLGHTYEGGLPSRPVDETLSKLLTPERIDYRVYSKDPAVRAKYYVERIRAYQEDNSLPEVWRILRRLEVRVERPRVSKGWLEYYAELDGVARRSFARTERVERDKWDPKRYQLRIEAGGMWLRPAVFWL